MLAFIGCTIVLAALPMALLNPMGRSAFLGYYLGVLTMWLTAVIAARSPTGTAESRRS